MAWKKQLSLLVWRCACVAIHFYRQRAIIANIHVHYLGVMIIENRESRVESRREPRQRNAKDASFDRCVESSRV
eukprot:scaffold40645_cov33-Attheya_sp.AAC.2